MSTRYATMLPSTLPATSRRKRSLLTRVPNCPQVPNLTTIRTARDREVVTTTESGDVHEVCNDAPEHAACHQSPEEKSSDASSKLPAGSKFDHHRFGPRTARDREVVTTTESGDGREVCNDAPEHAACHQSPEEKSSDASSERPVA
eukprot:scaffold96348_cov23-Phaeocystis_antarctica.AAC.1